METDKIIFGNAYELIKQVPDKSVDLIVTDPPYDFGIGGGGMSGGDGRMMGNLVNRASFGEHKEPTQREALLSEIRQAYRLGNWKRANDLRKHYAKLVKKKMRA